MKTSKTTTPAATHTPTPEVKRCPICHQRTERGFVMDWQLIHEWSKCTQAIARAEGGSR